MMYLAPSNYGIDFPYPLGHVPDEAYKHAANKHFHLRQRLQGLQSSLHLNVIDYTMVLNDMLVWIPYLHDEASLRVWLGEVQEFMRHISQRACAGYRLSEQEQQHVTLWVEYWRKLRGGPCCMGRPEAQFILLKLKMDAGLPEYDGMY